MKNRKYPLSLFITGVIFNMLFRYWFVILSAFIMLIIGFLNESFVKLGIIFLGVDIGLALAEQWGNRKVILEENDNPNFKEFQDAVLSGDWRKNVINMVESKIDTENSETE